MAHETVRVYHGLRSHRTRQTHKNGAVYFASQIEYVCRLPADGFTIFTGVTELPGVLGQGRCAPQKRLKGAVYLSTALAKLNQVVRLAKRATMPTEKALERLLHRLLCMQGNILQERWISRKLEVCRCQIPGCFGQPGPGFGDQREIMRHEEASPLASR